MVGYRIENTLTENGNVALVDGACYLFAPGTGIDFEVHKLVSML